MSGVRRSPIPRSAGLGTLAALAAALASCSDGGPKLYPVTGQVFYEDKPAEGATVVFEPASAASTEALRPSGIVDKDGSYTLRTHPHGEGAPEGEYGVRIMWLEPGKARDGEAAEAKNKLPARYGHAAQSGLKATVKPGDNTIEPFRLSKKAK